MPLQEIQTPKTYQVDISVKGEWIPVPAMDVGEDTLVVRGKWLKKATVYDEEWLEEELHDPALCVRTLKDAPSRALRADLFTFTQKLPATLPKYRYEMELESVAGLSLPSFAEWWEKLPQETRKNVRRAQKRGVEVKVKEFDDELIRAIRDVNNDSPVRQNVRNVYYGRTLEQVRKDYMSFADRSDFICAYVGEEAIGFLKLVYRGGVASILNLTTKASQSDKRPANALVAKAVELCDARRISHVTYGLYNYGNKQDSPLREFKIRNGFEEILVPRYYIPLTLRGRLCLRLGLHRGVLGILPHGLIVLGLAARSKWYNIKNSTSRCSSMPERPNRNRQMERSNPPAGSSS